VGRAPIAGSVGGVSDSNPLGDRHSVRGGFTRSNLTHDRSDRRLKGARFVRQDRSLAVVL